MNKVYFLFRWLILINFLGVALFAGFLFGLITMLVQYVGLFMSGLHTGLLLGLAALLAADHILETSPRGSVWLCVGILLASALLFAVLNLYFRKGTFVNSISNRILSTFAAIRRSHYLRHQCIWWCNYISSCRLFPRESSYGDMGLA